VDWTAGTSWTEPSFRPCCRLESDLVHPEEPFLSHLCPIVRPTAIAARRPAREASAPLGGRPGVCAFMAQVPGEEGIRRKIIMMGGWWRQGPQLWKSFRGMARPRAFRLMAWARRASRPRSSIVECRPE